MKSAPSQKELLEYLWGFLTEKRQQLFLDRIKHRTRHVTVAIENVFQPHNASAVQRSCDIFGINDVHIIENDNEYIPNPNVSMGSAKWLDMHHYSEKENNTADCLSVLKARGYRLVATTPHEKSMALHDLSLDKPLALLFGTELSGLSEEALSLSDETVYIPMHGFTESFNISVSASICLYDISQRLHASNINWQLSEEERNSILIEWCRRTVKDHENLEARFYSDRQQ